MYINLIQEVFLFEREGETSQFDAFLSDHAEDILNIFESLDIETNYFSMRESLKTSYMLMAAVRNESIRKHYISDKKRLRYILNTVLNQNKAIAYEAFLHLSLFILMPVESQGIKYILYQNKKMLNEFIINFQNDREDPNFASLKNAMRELLNDIEI